MIVHNKVYVFIACFTGLFVVLPDLLHSQSSENISNVAYRFEGSKLLITYDIIKAQSGETFEISLEAITASGETIIPENVFGDVKRGVVPGRKRTIIWDTSADEIILDENFTLNIYAIPQGRSEAVPDSIVQKYEFPRYTDVGLGLGLDYGGVFGGKFTYTPIKYLGIFAAGGFQLGGFGWQLGVKGYIIPKTSKKGFRPNIKIMYGINAVIFVYDAEQYNDLYPGFSLGPGMEFRFGRLKRHGVNADLNIPIRSEEFYNDWDKLKNDPTITIESEPLPFSISVGYHFEF